MAYYAYIEDGKVKRVLVTIDDWSYEKTQDWLHENTSEGNWVETYMNGVIKNKYAGIGDEYHLDIDSFISKKPFDSWVLDKTAKKYKAPKIKPDTKLEGFYYVWDESVIDWVLVKVRD